MAFSRGIVEIAKGNLLSPILRGELLKPRFRSFTINVDCYTERPYDGWFHPSTHASWGARKLALYMTQPQLIEVEEPTLEKVIAVTQGHFFHKLAGKIFIRNGIMKELEVYAKDNIHNRKGHMDGLLDGAGWEFKTVNNEYLLKKIYDLDSLKEYKPGYYDQAQDYLDMHELPGMRFLLMAMFYPYKMVEFVIPRDDGYIAAQRAKYREAIEMAAEHQLGDPCCAPRSTEARDCELRHACPLGRLAVKAGR